MVVEARVEQLQRELRNAKDREKRSRKTLESVMSELKEKNFINEELEQKLELYADIPLELLAKAGPAYSEKQREFALTLHLHGPKAYSYLSDVKHIPLPHPHTLQSRSPMGKGYKAPLSADNWEDTLSFFKEAKDYLLSMAREDGTPLFRTKRYLSIMGFIINIETLSLMVPKLLHTQRYVLTYRFSQDHLELLFNSIRASGERKTRERGRKRRVEIGREREMQP
uniref:uncharacterized protein isoform X1 n=1 Tax=Myxine glutinosa TaxID=7769 RepID=UPI00358F302D